jgi:N-acetylmuramic acid 6-phosphate etherase
MNLSRLETESCNPRTEELDRLSTLALVETLHGENAAVLNAVSAVLPLVAQLVDIVAERMGRGGRLFYIGAGTSGRLGVLDASECPPTFGIAPGRVQGLIAGGLTALTTSIEGAEDSPEIGAEDLQARGVGPNDVVVGIAASGRTPYVIGALDAARQAGAFAVALVNVSQAEMATHADLTLAAVTGPEALTGSTRLKAGTAQKLILNLLTTATMVRLGKVYGNLMVDVRATNVKLRDRAIRIVMAAADAPHADAEATLSQADWRCKTAIVMLKRHITAPEATRLLDASNGWVRAALETSESGVENTRQEGTSVLRTRNI